jgi:hypothetical protein
MREPKQLTNRQLISLVVAAVGLAVAFALRHGWLANLLP